MDAQANTKTDGHKNEDDNEGTPPLELAAVAGVLVGLLDLLVALLNVVDSILGIGLCGADDGVLLLDDSGEVVVEGSKLGESLLDALELVVAGADVTEDRAGVASAVCPEL